MNLHSVYRGKGSPLLMLHGWGTSSAVWSGMTDHFAARYETRVLDLPGHGKTAGMDIGLEKTIDAIGHHTDSETILVGWSLGGLLAQASACRTTPKALVLICSAPCFSRRESWPNALRPVDFDALSIQVGKDPEQALQRYFSFQMNGAEGARQSLRLLRSLTSSAASNRQALLWWVEFLKHTDLREQFRYIDCPVLAVLGEHDPVVPAAIADDLVALNSTVRVQVIEGAAHAPFLTHADQVTGAVEDFLHEC